MTPKENLPIYWSPDYVLKGGVETRTKSGPLAEILKSGEVPGIDLIAPSPVTPEELLVVHDKEYIDRLVNDQTPELILSIFSSTGGVRDALDSMYENGKAGSLSSGLHHARRDADMGYCYINGLALAALRAISKHGTRKVGVLDTDAHCGGGTFEIVGENERVRLADVSCNPYDIWQPDSDRHYLEIVNSASEYLGAVQRALHHLEGVDVLIYNAGMDPFEDCMTGGMPGITREILAERERIVAQWCEDSKTPAMFVLAGGYVGKNLDLDGVARLHLPTIREFARMRIGPKPKN